MGYLNTCYIQCSLHNHSICKTEARYWWCISQVSWNSNFYKFGEICPLFLCRDTQYYFHQSYCKKLSRLFRFAKFRSVISLDKFGPTGFLSMFNINDIYDYKSFHFNIFSFFLKKNKEKLVCITLNWLILSKRQTFNKLHSKPMSVETGNHGHTEHASDRGIME